MKKIAIGIISFVLFGMLSLNQVSAETAHYVNGVEGIKAASAPPPGIYWVMYNVFYTSGTLKDQDGEELSGADFSVMVYANVNRFVWISKFNLLGANYGADVLIPLVYTNFAFEIPGVVDIEDSKFGLADIVVEPLVMAWHGQRYDAIFALGAFLPTGSYDAAEPASPGKDFSTIMFTLGGTGYFDAAKTWSASVLSRYEIHTEKGTPAITAGHDFHFEWGVGKTLAKFYDVGVAGYCQWQVTEDSGEGATDVKDRVYAIGPEAKAFIPSIKLQVTLRGLLELGAVDRSQGICSTLNLTKIF